MVRSEIRQLIEMLLIPDKIASPVTRKFNVKAGRIIRFQNTSGVYRFVNPADVNDPQFHLKRRRLKITYEIIVDVKEAFQSGGFSVESGQKNVRFFLHAEKLMRWIDYARVRKIVMAEAMQEFIDKVGFLFTPKGIREDHVILSKPIRRGPSKPARVRLTETENVKTAKKSITLRSMGKREGMSKKKRRISNKGL